MYYLKSKNISRKVTKVTKVEKTWGLIVTNSAMYDSEKLKLIKNQKAKWLLGNLELKTPFM